MGSEADPSLWLPAAAAEEDVEVRVRVYGTAATVLGAVWIISAEREMGKSLRRIRVRDMWWVGWGWLLVEPEDGWSLGAKASAQASFGRKRGAEFEEVEVDLPVEVVIEEDEVVVSFISDIYVGHR